MSPWDAPVGAALIGFGIGSILALLAFAAICELIERWRRG